MPNSNLKSSPDGRVELVVLSVKRAVATCRQLGADRVIRLRAKGVKDLVPGEIAVVQPQKERLSGSHANLLGLIESCRLDVSALGLTPLALEDEYVWTPDEEVWQEPMSEWEREIFSFGERPSFEMEQVLPGEQDDDFDLICESVDLKEVGDREGAREILMDLCEADIRCLDAHAHLGNLLFDHKPEQAIRHYEVGVRIGELSLAPSRAIALPWSRINNRPFLRCMHGYGLCLWRLGSFEDAEWVFRRMLWFNPMDNQGVRFEYEPVKAKVPWEDVAKSGV